MDSQQDNMTHYKFHSILALRNCVLVDEPLFPKGWNCKKGQITHAGYQIALSRDPVYPIKWYQSWHKDHDEIIKGIYLTVSKASSEDVANALENIEKCKCY